MAGVAGAAVFALVVTLFVADIVRRHRRRTDDDFQTLPYDLRPGMESEMQTNSAFLGWVRRRARR